MMKKMVLGAVAVAAGAALYVLAPSPVQKLHVYTWSDYFDPELIQQFERENQCKVVIDTFDSNEAAFAKLAAGATGYDLLTPTSYFVPSMVRHGLVARFDTTRTPNVVANFDGRFSRFLVSTNFEHSVPYAFSMTGIMYRKNAVPEGVSIEDVGWNSMTNSAFGGRVSIFDDPREIIGCSLRTLGYSANSSSGDELKLALQVAKTWKRVASKMDNEMYKNAIASSELYVAMAYNSDAMQVMQEDGGVGFSIPRCGTTCSTDEFCISSTARRPDLAYAFVDFMYNPTNAARNIEYIFSVMPVKGAAELVDAELLNRELVFPSDETLSRCEILKVASESATAAYQKFWDELKASR